MMFRGFAEVLPSRAAAAGCRNEMQQRTQVPDWRCRPHAIQDLAQIEPRHASACARVEGLPWAVWRRHGRRREKLKLIPRFSLRR